MLLGYLGGKAFEDAPWKGLLIAFALALSIAGGVELVRHRRAAAARESDARCVCRSADPTAGVRLGRTPVSRVSQRAPRLRSSLQAR